MALSPAPTAGLIDSRTMRDYCGRLL